MRLPTDLAINTGVIMTLLHYVILVHHHCTVNCEEHLLTKRAERYGWFSWGVDSRPEGKSRCLCLAQLCEKYRLLSTALNP